MNGPIDVLFGDDLDLFAAQGEANGLVDLDLGDRARARISEIGDEERLEIAQAGGGFPCFDPVIVYRDRCGIGMLLALGTTLQRKAAAAAILDLVESIDQAIVLASDDRQLAVLLVVLVGQAQVGNGPLRELLTVDTKCRKRFTPVVTSTMPKPSYLAEGNALKWTLYGPRCAIAR